MSIQIPCYCGTLRQATRTLTTLYDARLAPAGIRSTQFIILETLSHLHEVRIRDLEGILAMDQTTLTRGLALLARRGLVAVVGRPSGREKNWGLTAEGAAILRAAKPLWEAAQAEIRRLLGAERARELHADVYRLVESLS